MEENKDHHQVNEEEQNQRHQHQQIWSWGAGTDGQLGTGKLQDELLPQLLHLLSTFPHPISSLSCGGAHVIALTSGGTVLTWGRGNSGQLGHGECFSSLSCPKTLSFFDGFFITHVSAGWAHSGFVSDMGSVFTCGDGSFGQLGHGDYESRNVPVIVSYLDDKRVEKVACGMRHSLVLVKDSPGKQVYSFGSGKRGQLGIYNNRVKSIILPEVTCGLEDVEVVTIVANGDHSAALSVDGNLYTWGRGFTGHSDALTPERLVSCFRFSDISLGWNHALVLTDGGQAYMLGGNRHGVLSDSEKMSLTHLTKHIYYSEPELDRISGLEGTKVVQIAAGAEHSALATGDGVIMTWGWGEHGQLGLGNTTDQTNPQAISLCNEAESEGDLLEVYCGSGFTFAIRSSSLVGNLTNLKQ